MSAQETTSSGHLEAVEGRRHEVLGILASAASVLLTLALGSYDAQGGTELVGPVGTKIASVLAAAFGAAAWILPAELALSARRLFRGRPGLLGAATIASTVVIVLIGCAMVHLAVGDRTVFGGHPPGGLLGEVFGEVLASLLGVAGAFVIGGTVLLITMVLRTPWSISQIASGAAQLARGGAERAQGSLGTIAEAWREARELEAAARKEFEPRIVGADEDEEYEDEEYEDEEYEDGEEEEPEDALAEEASTEEPEEEEEEEPEEVAPRTVKAAKKSRAPKIVSPPRVQSAVEDDSMGKTEEAVVSRGKIRPFVLPPSSLLDDPPEDEIRIDKATLRDNANLLTEKLEAYRVKGRVDEIHPGPVVTMYEFEPASGTKISKIASLSDDLAMALAAQKVRIVAPIPGKARVGFELPNETRQTVYLRRILEDARWKQQKGALPVALGQDIAGQAVYGDLAKMPHLLVAGATGAGKSVGLNVMLVSLLCKKTPEECRMLMIDPKVVELAVFDGIPHMLLPVVTDMKKAALALRWAVDEMERRYQLFADAGARNIQTYNKKVDRVLDGELDIAKVFPKRANKVKALGPDGEEVHLPPSDGERPDALDTPPEKLPYIVVVVDEFADLMMVAAKDVESCIARLAQKARAAGIHVILATQRPSVDVITGMIKANFPARMAFKVSQREDSKTILGRQGAEHLLGMGDMLFIPPGSSDLKRVHSAYISEDEVKEVCDHLREQGKPVYDDDILKPRDDDGDNGSLPGGSSDDPLYDKAVAVVANAGYCSISHIQRQLSVGYNKAAKLVERMEKEGVVGPPSGKAGGRREVLIQPI